MIKLINVILRANRDHFLVATHPIFLAARSNEEAMLNYSKRLHEIKQVLLDIESDAPNLSKRFGALHQSEMAAGKLSAKMKELMALAISIAVRCDGCIAYQMNDAIEAGASKEEIMETIGVAVVMGGGAALVYGTDAYRAYHQILNDSQDYGADETFIDE